MSFSLAQEPDASSTSMLQGNGPLFRPPMRENTFVSTVYATSVVTPSQTVSAATSAPQFVQTALSSIVTRSPQSNQSPLTILVSPPTSSLAPVPFGSPIPPFVVTSISPVSSINPKASDSSESSSVSLSSTPIVLSIVTPAAATSTALTSASVTPTATTVTEAVVEVPSSSPSQPANENSTVTEKGHHAPFYIAVIVGTILAIGLIAAVIAWAVRLRMHARRRRESPLVPWANHHEDQSELEAARDAIFIGQPIDRTGSKDISSQDVIPWELSGDRDVGEPRRSSSYMRNSLRSSLVPGPSPYAEHQPYVDNASHVTYSNPYYYSHASTRDANLSSNGSLDEYSSISSLGPLQVANRAPGDTSPSSTFTSIPEGMYTAHTGGASNYGSRAPSSEPYGEGVPRSNVPWSRNTKETWNTLPLPGRTQDSTEETVMDDSSSWTTSIKSNFTYAFNAVAASLPSGAVLMINRQDKTLDAPARSTQSSGRQSLFSVFSRSNDSTANQPWTLEERGNGTGRVLFPDVEADGYNHGFTTSESQYATSMGRTSTRDSISSPLAQPPRSAVLKPEDYDTGSRLGRGLRQPSMRSTLSTTSTSSAYSMASAPRLPELSRHSTIKLDTPMATVFEEAQSHSLQRPATLVTRSSSSGCSVHSYYYGVDATYVDGAESMEGQESRQQALVDRRRRSRRVV